MQVLNRAIARVRAFTAADVRPFCGGKGGNVRKLCGNVANLLSLPSDFPDAEPHTHSKYDPQPGACRFGKWKRDGAHCRMLCFLPTGVLAFRLVQMLRRAVDELPVKNEP